MADSVDELLIATSCLLLATASQLSVTLNLLSRRRRTVWVQNYLKKGIICKPTGRGVARIF